MLKNTRGKPICQLIVIARHHGSGVTWRTSILRLSAGNRRFNEVSFCLCPEAKKHLFQEQASASSDLLCPVLLWARRLALVLCVSQSSLLVLVFLCLLVFGSPWFITYKMTSTHAACWGWARARNMVEQKVPHASPAFTGQIQLSSLSLWSQNSFLSLWASREPVAFNNSFAQESILLLVLQQSVKRCRLAPLQAICPASDGEEELLTVLSKMCLAILPFGQTCCALLAWTSISAASGNYPVHLPQLLLAWSESSVLHEWGWPASGKSLHHWDLL